MYFKNKEKSYVQALSSQCIARTASSHFVVVFLFLFPCYFFPFGWHCSAFVPLIIFEIHLTCALTLFHLWSMMSEFGPQGLAIRGVPYAKSLCMHLFIDINILQSPPIDIDINLNLNIFKNDLIKMVSLTIKYPRFF